MHHQKAPLEAPTKRPCSASPLFTATNFWSVHLLLVFARLIKPSFAIEGTLVVRGHKVKGHAVDDFYVTQPREKSQESPGIVDYKTLLEGLKERSFRKGHSNNNLSTRRDTHIQIVQSS